MAGEMDKRDEIQTNRHLIAPRISKLNIYAAHAALATLLPRASLAVSQLPLMHDRNTDRSLQANWNSLQV
jgi:hypothetical protein